MPPVLAASSGSFTSVVSAESSSGDHLYAADAPGEGSLEAFEEGGERPPHQLPWPMPDTGPAGPLAEHPLAPPASPGQSARQMWALGVPEGLALMISQGARELLGLTRGGEGVGESSTGEIDRREGGQRRGTGPTS